MTRPGFEEYVTARGGSLLRFAYLLCGDPHLAEDLVQEVLIKAHRRWSAIEADDPEVYVKRALVRTHISWLRRRASSELAVAAVPERSDAGFDDAHASRDEVWTMLARLPRSQRAVLVLRYFEDLDDHRIAELVGVSPSTVRTHAQKGLRTLRETLTAAAQEAPSGVGLLEEVRRGVARRMVRRRAVAGGLAALLLAAVASLAVLLPAGRSEPPVQPTPSPTSSSGLVLVPTTLTAPVFPYTFSYLPPGVGPAAVGVESGGVGVSFGAAGCECPPLEIRISADQWDTTEIKQWASSVTINGAPATLWEYPTGDALVEWQRDGRWLYASQASRRGGERVSVADLLRFAEGLRPGVTVSAERGGIDSVASVQLPAGHVIASRDAGSLCSAPTFTDGSFPRLCIFVGPPSAVEAYGDEITVDGLRAFHERGGTTAWLTVEVSAERHVAISYQEDLIRRATVTLDDLIAIYHGIVFTQ